MKSYNFVYKTTFSDGKYYIGQHKTNNLNDGYFGSSRVVKDLVKQGINCNREILRYCDTQKELNYWEKYYIGDNYKNDDLCLNVNNSCGIIEEGVMFGKKLSEEHKRKISYSNKIRYKDGCPDSTRKKMSDSLKGKAVGKIWMRNGEKTIMINPEKIEDYINKGYVRGRGHNLSWNTSKKGKPSTIKGRHRVYDNPEKTKYHYE